MSLYYEAAAALNAPASDGGNLKTRIFGPRSRDNSKLDTGKPGSKDGKDAKGKPEKNGKNSKTDSKAKKNVIPPAQIYALAAESCKWSAVLAEVIDRAELLVHERRTLPTPTLALLLVHDLLVGKGGAIQLPANHGLRMAVERHKARLASELARVRVRRRAANLIELRAMVERDVLKDVSSSSLAAATRWVRVNTLKTTLDEQLATTFAGYERAASIKDLFGSEGNADEESASSSKSLAPRIYIDEHVPNLVAVPLMSAPSSSSLITDLTRCDAYKSGAIVFQDKASCFPAYLLDPSSVDGDIIDACAAPGNKTSHLAALLQECSSTDSTVSTARHVFAFEKDSFRSKTLETMQAKAGALECVTVNGSQDFMKVNPKDERYQNVNALLLDPSCSGSGIVGRDAMPTLHLPKAPPPLKTKPKQAVSQQNGKGKKRKRGTQALAKDEAKDEDAAEEKDEDDQNETEEEIPEDPAARLEALASFQLSLLLRSFSFPAAKRVTYSTCSIHAQENEQVVVKALRAINKQSHEGGRWRLLRRDEQVAGMRAWPVRGDHASAEVEEEEGDEDEDDDNDNDEIDPAAVADACIRSYANDDLGVMGFFVAAFVKDDGSSLLGAALSNRQANSAQPKKKKNKKNKKKKKAATAIAAVDTAAESAHKDENDDGWGGFDD
ncbi:nol1 nop2 sun family protein [Ophiostoma piceae UAMH 11346]|uniref:Nol1 nop2 sun family protein n=1 Tax=Ophiostoma piceae (strain UAMH 11346) TaxID=1262450 RepID=S3BZH1_OPHP1|nr:nol1 nop2 sun family protein [Ophiostoma piceae UAMH 11346]